MNESKAVTLIKDGMNCYFETQKAAIAFLKVPESTFYGDCVRGCKCRGWKIKSGYVEPEPLEPIVITQIIHPVLRVNGLLAQNKTEREYYKYLAEKGAKA